MSRRYSNGIMTDYICRECGSVNSYLDSGNKKPMYSSYNVYCPTCMDIKEAIKICDGDLLKQKLLFSNPDTLSDIEIEIKNLLDMEHKKVK